MLDFDLTDRIMVSSGLASSLRARGIYDQKTFSLEISKGPLLEYLTSLPLEFYKRFHIGCSSDGRPPSFSYKSVMPCEEELYLMYDRKLNGNGNEIWPTDEKKERDLEKLAVEFSNPVAYNERIIIGCHVASGMSISHPHVEISIQNCNINYVDSLEDLQGIDGGFVSYLRKAVEDRIKGSILDYHDGPNKNNELLNSGLLIKDMKEIGIPAGQFVSEFIRLYSGSVGDISLFEEFEWNNEECKDFLY